MDPHGYVDVPEFLALCEEQQRGPTSMSELEEIVATSDKQRFGFNQDRTRVRANQGHSIDVYLTFDEVKGWDGPVYHGTSVGSVLSICMTGIQKMERRYVHLSQDLPTAKQVGSRHDKQPNELVIIEVQVQKLLDAGHRLWMSDNNVLLVEHAPPEFLGPFHWFTGSGEVVGDAQEITLALFEYNLRMNQVDLRRSSPRR
jgi:putative RNA 2'-phosphotransferase